MAISNRLPQSAKFLIRPLSLLGRFFLLVAVLPLYKTYLVAKKFTTKFYAPEKIRHKIIHPFSRRFLIHVIISIIAAATVTANLNANEINRENIGQKSIIGSIIVTDELGEISVEGPMAANQKVNRYLGSNAVTSGQPGDSGSTDETGAPTTVTGGSAVVQPILSPVEEGLRERNKIVNYTVQPGDTISQIAEQFGVSVNTILWANNLSAYSLVRPGNVLTILPVTGIQHKVAKNQTVANIAKLYGISTDAIIEFNKLASANDINVGEQLVIPGGKKIASAPVAAKPANTVPRSKATPVSKVVAGSGMTWPTTCRRISQYFRYGHSAVDIACGFGQAIYATDDGKVIKAQGGYNGGYGLMIIIDHGNGIQTLYGHLSSIYVQVGEDVAKGQNIAAMGSTGHSTGPHVHFEVRINGVKSNPLRYVN